MADYVALFYADVTDEDGINRGQYIVEESLLDAKNWDDANNQARDPSKN